MIPLSQFTSIDPGFSKSNGTGWGYFYQGFMGQCGLAQSQEEDFLVRCKEIRAQIPGAPAIPRIIEHMRIYPGPQQKGDQNDLLNLAFLEGLLASDTTHVELYPARTWKGQVPKDILCKRIAGEVAGGTGTGKFNQAEYAILCAALAPIRSAEKRQSLIEGVGIGLWRAGRL